ncbi:toll-like receptor 13 [Mytilus galloprovincialis]|uniref:Toll-like receptor 13 n=1 Tax=Mytilus galloprovincialis TaxID=29158 RepID=A0A8B6HEK5_MYTGA|nr:toll-like receptor 13 [Mytilus galloprovincialis]
MFVLCISDTTLVEPSLAFNISKNNKSFNNGCSSNRRCKCLDSNEGILADCSALGLTKSPHFQEGVVSVNLSFNLIIYLPDEGYLPTTLRHLDLTKNKISKFRNHELVPFSNVHNIISLNLSSNFLSLDDDTYYTGVFQNLKYLQYLDVSNNSNENRSYYCPDKVFQELSSLQNLLIDGVQNVTFGKGFSTLKNLTMLKITGIAVQRIINKEYFDNFPNLEHLDISATLEWRNITDFALTNFEKGSLQKLQKLQYLDISYHRKLRMCGFRNVTNDLPKTSIRILKANYLECERSVSTVLFVEDIKPLSYTKLEELYLDGNNLEETDYFVPLHLPMSLNYFSAKDNRWVINRYAYFYIAGLTGIITVDLSFQNKHQFSQSNNAWLCSETSHETTHCICDRVPPYVGESSFLNNHLHQHLWQASNKFDNFPLITSCIPYDGTVFELALIPVNTETIIIESAKVGEHIPPIYFSTSSVRKISLRNNQIYSFTGPICNLTNLQYFDLSSNRAVDISSYVFGSLTGLKHLEIDNNLLGNSNIFNTDDSAFIFENQTNLMFLNMSSNRLSILFRNFLIKSSKLNTILMDHNLLTDWNISLYHMKDLQFLDISWNEILYLSSDGMNLLEKAFHVNTTIDISNNPFECSCNSIYFLKWLQLHQKHFKGFDSYSCTYLHQYFDIPEANIHLIKDCNSYVGVIVSAAIGIIVFLAVISSMIIHRYRWKLRYWYYIFKGAYGGDRVKTACNFQFDVFVSYAEKDRWFPKEHMIEYLEKQGALRLCIHDRDFIAGSAIAENITNAIHNSRKFVCILTNNFLKSKWCMYEFNMALEDIVVTRQGKNSIIIVQLSRTDVRNIPREMRYIMNEDTYIDYPEDEENRVIFWESFERDLKF